METFVKIYLYIFSNLFWINIIFAVILIFFERKNPTSTWLWIMVINFLPIVGFLLYLILGQDMSKKKMFTQKAEDDFCFKDLVGYQEEKLWDEEYVYKNTRSLEIEDIIKMNLKISESYFSEDNSIELYYSGQEKFNNLLESIYNAKKHIHLEYYIFKYDGIGKKIIDALTQKAKEGLEVKVLYDGMGGRRLREKHFEEFKKAGGEVAIFFPALIPFISLRINYRNHRKICVIDGQHAYLGGFNIGDEYLGKSKKFGYWRDTHMKITGSAVGGLQWRFLKDWAFASNSRTNNCEIYLPSKNYKGDAGVQIVSSGPDSKWENIKNNYFKMITSSESKVYIQTPYFIPDDSILEALKIASLSGVDIRIMIPNKPDHPFVYWASLSYIGELLEAGARAYTYEKGFLHSKSIIMDDYVSTVGTANLDIRSFKLNFEVNAFIYDENINLNLTEQFKKDLKDCKEITMEDYNNRSIIVKIKESISRLLSPIL